jgi:hypothetical protein
MKNIIPGWRNIVTEVQTYNKKRLVTTAREMVRIPDTLDTALLDAPTHKKKFVVVEREGSYVVKAQVGLGVVQKMWTPRNKRNKKGTKVNLQSTLL